MTRGLTGCGEGRPWASTPDDFDWLYDVFLPKGRRLTPQQLLDIIQSDEDASRHEGRPVAIYRALEGKAYVLGLHADRHIWKRCGYQIAGTVPLLRKLMVEAERIGVRKDSLVWVLLTDVESGFTDLRRPKP